MSKVVSLKAVREIKDAQAEDHAYCARILTMDKMELLEEMVRFQEERSRSWSRSHRCDDGPGPSSFQSA